MTRAARARAARARGRRVRGRHVPGQGLLPAPGRLHRCSPATRSASARSAGARIERVIDLYARAARRAGTVSMDRQDALARAQPAAVLCRAGPASGVEDRLGAGRRALEGGRPGRLRGAAARGVLEVLHEAAEGEVVVLRTMDSGRGGGRDRGHRRPRRARRRVRARTRLPHAARSRPGLPGASCAAARRPGAALLAAGGARAQPHPAQVTRTHRAAITDPLTRLYNFGFFRERLEIELERARGRPADLVSLVPVRHRPLQALQRHQRAPGGQRGADRRWPRILKRAGRRGDILARYGGEEFVALLYGATREEAARFAEAVREASRRSRSRAGTSQPRGGSPSAPAWPPTPATRADDAALLQGGGREPLPGQGRRVATASCAPIAPAVLARACVLLARVAAPRGLGRRDPQRRWSCSEALGRTAARVTWPRPRPPRFVLLEDGQVFVGGSQPRSSSVKLAGAE